ncbi:MAG TPA: DUF58 domain-containing protein, partial [Pirellulales bacterium]|nr:DUF58 domain-containing protein [Pirellulales bacterium]
MNPVLLILALVVPLVALGTFLGTYPRRPLVLALLLPALGSLTLLVTDTVLAPLLVADLVIALVAIADLLTLPPRRTFLVEREAGRIASLRQLHPVQLTVNNLSSRKWRVELRD